MHLIAAADLSRRRRGPFLAPTEILVLAAMVGALLFLLFPGRDFETAPRWAARPDPLSVAYHRAVVRAYPDFANERLRLAHELTVVGQLDEAHDTLGPLLGRSDGLGHRARLLALQIDRVRLYAIPQNDPRYPAKQQQVRLAATNLIPATTRLDDLAELADFVLELGDPGEAAHAYQRLSVLDEAHAVGWLEKAGRWSFAAGDPALAAKFFGEASLRASDAGQGVRLAREALSKLLAADQGKAGLVITRLLVERYPRDLGLLEQAVAMARAAGDLGSARRWTEQLVVTAGSSDAALRQQIAILSEGGDPAGAVKVARVLLQRTPNDPALHRQVAQLARWSAQPELAMTHWKWLARTGSEEGRKNAYELAQALNDGDLQLEMLEMLARKAHPKAAPSLPELDAPAAASPDRAPRVTPPRAWPERRRPQV